MSRGYDQHQARQQAIALLGKDLARRARSRCELCDANGVKLLVFEVPPSAEPSLERSLMACETCHAQLQPKGRLDPDHWRCLNTAVWSETPAVQVTAVRMIDRLAHIDWANELKQQLWLSPEVQAWLEEPLPRE